MKNILKGNIASISPILESIREFDSSNKEALPQRSNRDIEYDSQRDARDANGKSYSTLKDEFINNFLFNGQSDCSGIYFFLNRTTTAFNPFYIGISGTRKSQGRFLKQRFADHLRTFDYFFFSLAFPENIDLYFNDCIRFYASGKYKGKMKTYVRQFKALKEVKFDHIAWVSESSYSNIDWDEIENYFVSIYKPKANGSKLNATRNVKYKEKYLAIEQYLFHELLSLK